MGRKTRFAEEIAERAHASHLTLAEVAKKAGKNGSYPSKLKAGNWGTIPEPTLLKMVHAAARDPKDQAKLIAEYLRDICPPEYERHIEINALSESPDTPGSINSFNAQLRVKLSAIGVAYIKDDGFRKMVDALAAMAKNVP